MQPPYQKILKPEEFETCVKSGAALTFIKNGQGVGDALGAVGTLGDFSTRALLAASLVTGIPVGIMMHVVGKKIGQKRAKERDMENEIKYYRQASGGLEQEMARQGMIGQ